MHRFFSALPLLFYIVGLTASNGCTDVATPNMMGGKGDEDAGVALKDGGHQGEERDAGSSGEDAGSSGEDAGSSGEDAGSSGGGAGPGHDGGETSVCPDLPNSLAEYVPQYGCSPTSVLTYQNFGQPFMLNNCTACHSHHLATLSARQYAMPGVNFTFLEDTNFPNDGIRHWAHRIYARTCAYDLPAYSFPNGVMPPVAEVYGGCEERVMLAEWLACGAPE